MQFIVCTVLHTGVMNVFVWKVFILLPVATELACWVGVATSSDIREPITLTSILPYSRTKIHGLLA